MDRFLATGDAFIWLTSVAAGLVLCWGAYRFLVAKRASPQQAAILGQWYGYAYYHSEEGDRLFKEKINVLQGRFLPWRLTFEATSTDGLGSTIYKGKIRHKGHSFFVSTSYEPVFDDVVFEISRLLMDGGANAYMMIGLCMGMTFDKSIHCANAYVWSRTELDPDANQHRPADRGVETTYFNRIVKRYFSVSADTFQLKML